jgi:hypothetical protein
LYLRNINILNVLVVFGVLTSCDEQLVVKSEIFSSHVYPFIETVGHGHTYPGATKKR